MPAFGLPQLASLSDPSAAADQAQLDRQALIAKMLRQQAMTPIDTNRQIGGMAYRISPLEGVAKILQGYKADQMDEEGDKARTALATKQAQAYANALRGILGDGAPATGQPEAPGSAPGSAPAGAPQSSLSPEARKAAMSAYLMGNNELGNKIVGSAFEVTPEMKNLQFKGIDPRALGRAEMGKAQKDALMELNPNQTVYDPASGQTRFTAPSAPSPQVDELTQTLKAAGIDPASPQGQAIYSQFAQKQATHQPATSVSVNTEKTYAGNIAEGVARQELGVVDAARSAPERITTSQNIKALLAANPITGSGAEWRLGVHKALATAGVIDPKQVANTETLASMLASSTLDAIKTSGLGAGQGFTDKDRQFLERARSGNLETNPQTLKTLADLNERAGQASLERANTIIKKWQGNPNLNAIGAQPIAPPAPTGVRVVDW